STPRHHNDQLGAEISKDVGAGPAKAVTISEQHDHRGNAPGHSQHGECGAAAIGAHGAVRFLEQIVEHFVSTPGVTPAVGLPPAAAWRLSAQEKYRRPLPPRSGSRLPAQPTSAPI